ncbi:phosphatidate cytidylyltransferase [Rhodoblastus acidophilus]|uniref:Phosphatidate cytidylyltransferase n=1 Tax=Candidatus Rhodoblastus alkanivorans TaxID=2954117 RepID=A0ABS9Z700_9HYPH|nr:phosphatidate cytidylyltransferase [Candidatus Rhodoblastus alkanivorans]MCI4679199.1 phosphatidate cytidylyltransferase [Candidatus Rhodoblastus alkanivorans]MCI4683195.1 phosphatidate cytidylyltransferase [Candidatus Rhodoblastus alkanivorans]MDI4640507.1 phosphatidate cytidylyltransferase [Rhodoblastus acidophilus]
MNKTDSPPHPGKANGAQGVMARHHLEDLSTRTASALVLAAAAAGSLAVGGWIFALFWLVAALAVNWEWQRLIGAPLPWLRMFVGAGVLCAATILFRFRQTEFVFLLAPLAAGFAAWAAGPGFRLWAGFGLFYAGGLLLSVLSLRHDPFFGACAIAWLFAVVWGTDICAYFAGRLIGGPKLAMRISPGKTWSGFLVGVSCGAALGAVVAHMWPNAQAPLIPVFLLGLVAGALAQAGDLFESWVKRRFGVKDSSHLIPGHGGVMDRIDGFIAAAIFAALFGLWRAVPPSAAAGLFYWQ